MVLKGGYTGQYCQISPNTVCIGNNNPCQHSGSCTSTGNGGYICNCLQQWTGVNCQICRCMNGGQCNLNGNNPPCICPRTLLFFSEINKERI
jgi:hypothetical protein